MPTTLLPDDSLRALLAAVQALPAPATVPSGDRAPAATDAPAPPASPVGRPAHARAGEWMLLVHGLQRAAQLPVSARAEYLSALGVAWSHAEDAVPTLNADVGHVPTTPIARFATRARREIEDMERAHAFDLAESAIAAVCTLLAAEPARERAIALVHRGRILRQQSRLGAAEASYAAAIELRVPARFHGLAWLGLGIVHRTRGNRPREIAAAKRALRFAGRDSLLAANAHHLLTNTYLSLGELEPAFAHAWRLFELVGGHAEREVGALINLGFVALDAGFPREAQHVFDVSERRAPALPRLRLSLFQGMARAGGALRSPPVVRRAETLGRDELARSSHEHHWEAARLLYALADAWLQCGELQRAAAAVLETESIARRHGLHELAHRADALNEAIGRAVREADGSAQTTPRPARTPEPVATAVAAYADRLLTIGV